MSSVFHNAAAKCRTTLTPGAISSDNSSLDQTGEDLRIDQLIPAEILEDQDKLKAFLEAYYTFQNLDEFIYQETLSFEDVVLNGNATFRIADPNNENNKFFTDDDGANSTLVITDPDGTTTNITLSNSNVTISNGNELPGSLATLTSEVGKTFTVSGLSAHNNKTAKLTTIQKNWTGPGPSYVINTIEEAMNIDDNDTQYLELMQKEIAATVPRDVTVNKRNLYKRIVDLYKVRGSSDSIEIFFRLLFNDTVEVEFPFDKTLIPSSGDWEVDSTLPKGGIYLDKKGFLSDDIKIQDSLKFQKFSYLIKTGKNLTDWQFAFNKLIHPAGFKYFAEILIFIQLTQAALGNLKISYPGLLHSAMPNAQPGAIGLEDIPVLVELFASSFLPRTYAKIHRSGTLSLSLKGGVIDSTTVTSGGSGYISAPTITTSDSGTPSGFTTATLSANIANGSVTSITLTDGGKDYNVPVLTFAAPAPIVFDGSDDEVAGTGIINITDNTIKLTSAQAAALPINSRVTYNSGGGTSIGGLVSGTQYFIVFNTSNEVKLSATQGGSVIDITGVGSGTNHSFTGETATGTAVSVNGVLDTISIANEGYGYATAPSINFNSTPISGLTAVNPSVTIGIDVDGRLDVDNIVINSRGKNHSQLFANPDGNTNAGKIASVFAIGRADKNYSVAPSIVFPEPTSVDADGNPLSSNITATATFTLDANGEITGTSITNPGNGYVDDPEVRIDSAVQNEIRTTDKDRILDISCNMNDLGNEQLVTSVVTNPVQSTGSIMTSTETAVKFLPAHTVKVINNNWRTIQNNGYNQRKGPQNFFNSPRLYNTNQTIEFLGNNQLQTIDSTVINKYNTRTFINLE